VITVTAESAPRSPLVSECQLNKNEKQFSGFEACLIKASGEVTT
jgi:hypothetical protein